MDGDDEMSLTTEAAPRLISGMSDEDYHSDPALSSSGAKRLLPPSCPALFQHERQHGRPPKASFDYGHAAHAKVLGIGAELVVVEAEDWRTKAAQQQRAEAYAAGKVPVLAREARQVDAMADAIAAHPLASALLDPDRGAPEQSIFWRDNEHGIERRARLDWLPDSDGGRLIVADYKSAISAERSAIRKAVASFGYYQQAPWYIDALHALGLAEEVAFLFVFQEKAAPYLVNVVELDAEAMRIGRQRNHRAMEVFAECSATGVWPGYSDDVDLISLPGWATYLEESA